jgi:hypothetical protein
MPLEASTATLLKSVLSSESGRRLFQNIALRRVAPRDSLIRLMISSQTESAPLGKETEGAANVEAAEQLNALKDADLIAASTDGEKFYVTAKGLKVARDLGNLTDVRV